jgi:hypothetical protein
MKSFLTKALKRSKLGHRLLLAFHDISRRRHLKKFKNPEDLFTSYYRDNQWSDPESVSGPGSTAAYTENIRVELPQLFSRLGIKAMLDAPCGDYNWFRLIDRPNGHDYIGGDIVAPLIESNNFKHRNEQTRFIQIDVTKDPLPSVDLWLCRDCLFHLSEELVFMALQNFARSEIKWILTSTHPKATFNSDITTGSFRLINLELPPYNLPAPDLSIVDWIEPHPYRHLALWSRESVVQALANRGNRGR